MHLLSLFSIFLSGSAAIAAPSLEKSQIAIQVDDTHKAPSEISDHDPKPLQLGPPLPENSPRGDLDEAFYLEVSFDDPARRGANSAFYGFSASHWGAHGELGYESIFRLENKRLVHEGFEVAYSPLRLLPYMTALNFAPDSHADFDFQVVPHEVGGKTVHYLEFLVPGVYLGCSKIEKGVSLVVGSSSKVLLEIVPASKRRHEVLKSKAESSDISKPGNELEDYMRDFL